MGWTCRSTNGTKLTKDEEMWEIKHAWYPYEIIESSKVGTTWYLAIRHKNNPNEIFAGVVLTESDKNEFCYKEMDETEGPVEDNCPMKIMKLLTPTKYEYAIEWRKRVMNKHKNKNKMYAHKTIIKNHNEIRKYQNAYKKML